MTREKITKWILVVFMLSFAGFVAALYYTASTTPASELPEEMPLAAEPAAPAEPEAPAEPDAQPEPAAHAVPAAQPVPDLDAGLMAHERRIIELFEHASPSVVFITTLGGQANYFGRPNLSPQGAGSGLIWDHDGHIVTNFHVIAQAREAIVTLSDGTEWPASFVGAAPDHDLAVLKIQAPKEQLRPLKRGHSKPLRVGQFAMAIGNPFGLDQTLTTGVISALDRQIESISGRQIYGVIQTDAAINPGNSGGPLLSSEGKLIGVNTAIRSPSGSSAGIGFAVPVDTVTRIVPLLIKDGRVSRAGLGILLASPTVAQRFQVKGAIIAHISPDSPAEKAGMTGMTQDPYGRIRLGDIITAFNGQPIKNTDDLLRLLDDRQVGETVSLTLNRHGETVALSVVLAALN